MTQSMSPSTTPSRSVMKKTKKDKKKSKKDKKKSKSKKKMSMKKSKKTKSSYEASEPKNVYSKTTLKHKSNSFTRLANKFGFTLNFNNSNGQIAVVSGQRNFSQYGYLDYTNFWGPFITSASNNSGKLQQTIGTTADTQILQSEWKFSIPWIKHTVKFVNHGAYPLELELWDTDLKKKRIGVMDSYTLIEADYQNMKNPSGDSTLVDAAKKVAFGPLSKDVCPQLHDTLKVIKKTFQTLRPGEIYTHTMYCPINKVVKQQDFFDYTSGTSVTNTYNCIPGLSAGFLIFVRGTPVNDSTAANTVTLCQGALDYMAYTEFKAVTIPYQKRKTAVALSGKATWATILKTNERQAEETDAVNEVAI